VRPRLNEPPVSVAADPHFARVEVFEDMGSCEVPWRKLEAVPTLATPYQRYEFFCLWQRHVGTEEWMTPFVMVAFNAAGEPLFLWPLGRGPAGSLQVVEFLGGKHANFNMRCGGATLRIALRRMICARSCASSRARLTCS